MAQLHITIIFWMHQLLTWYTCPVHYERVSSLHQQENTI